jgi:hypothetical protein
MIQARDPDSSESVDDISAADHCTLLDEYWDALKGESAALARGRLIDRGGKRASIAENLDVLELLHQARTGGRTGGSSWK